MSLAARSAAKVVALNSATVGRVPGLRTYTRLINRTWTRYPRTMWAISLGLSAAQAWAQWRMAHAIVAEVRAEADQP